MRYIIGLLVTIGLIVLIFVLLLRGSGPGTVVSPVNLVSYASSNATAQLVIDGPIIANQNHSEVQILIGKDTTTFNLYQGYNQNLVNTQSYANNQSAFAVFLQALNHYGFTKGNPAPTDERGQCAEGERYIYSLVSNGKSVERYWNTSCNTGTFKGKTSVIIDLFRSQIPDYGKLTLTANL